MQIAGAIVIAVLGAALTTLLVRGQVSRAVDFNSSSPVRGEHQRGVGGEALAGPAAEELGGAGAEAPQEFLLYSSDSEGSASSAEEAEDQEYSAADAIDSSEGGDSAAGATEQYTAAP